MIFGSVQIKADGTVHACACRDVDGSLRLGHLDQAPLSSIVSTANPAYTGLIDDQQQGTFLPNCRACSAYTSIYDFRRANFPSQTSNIPLDEALAMVGEKTGKADPEARRDPAQIT